MSRHKTVPITQASKYIGRTILQMSAGRLRAWKNYRVITSDGSQDPVTNMFHPSGGGRISLLGACELKDGTISVLLARDGVPVANRILCHPEGTITIC